MFVVQPRSKPVALRSLVPGIERVLEIVILGVTISEWVDLGAQSDQI